MSLYWNILLVIICCLALCNTEDLMLGSTVNGQLGYQETIKLSSIPFTSRNKNVFYNTNNTRIIKGILAVDIDQTNTKPTITAGGVNMSFVNLRFKSAKGVGLNYLVQIFV